MPRLRADAPARRDDRSNRSGHVALALGGTLVALTIDNYLTNRVVPDSWYVPTRVTTTCVVLVLGLVVARLTPAEIGLDRTRLAPGVVWGGAAVAVEIGIL